MKYAVVIEKGESNFSAYCPDLPGLAATGRTMEELRSNLRGGLELHLEGLVADGEPIPPAEVQVEYVEAPVPEAVTQS